jgi:pyruvate/2-oxoglutarate dehydrogenase complex dihydrolipoamide dehydrogenase (E3) component
VLGSRVNIPADEFQQDSVSGEPITVSLQNGTILQADVVIPATGQTPNTQFLSSLPASSDDSLISRANGFIRVKPTLQFQDPKYPHIFAVGDIADSGAHKAARPGAAQAQVVAKNILDLVEGREPAEKIEVSPPGIHLTLGLVSVTPSTAPCTHSQRGLSNHASSRKICSSAIRIRPRVRRSLGLNRETSKLSRPVLGSILLK